MNPRASLLLTAALWLSVLGLLAAHSLRHDRQWDWTAGQRNTLTSASRDLLASMPDPVQATAYVFPDADSQRDIRARFAPYQREKTNFSLHFVDPATAPQTVRELGIAQSGEVLLDYQGRRESLTTLSEAEISAALQRLSHADAALIVFAAGHGERDPEGSGPSSYSALAGLLRDKGLALRRVVLATQELPPQTSLLVLAAPQASLLPGELERIRTWLDAGGKLLWLSDPHLPPLPELAAALSLDMLPGTLIYQDYELLGSGHPAMALVATYPDHPVTRRLDALTAFPLAGALQGLDDSPWQLRPLLRSVERSWLESGPIEGSLVYDSGTDRLGPLSLGLALRRERGGADQRVAVIADSDFASDAYIHQLGNRAFAIALFQWLLARDAQIHIDLPPAPDSSLQLSPLATRLLGLSWVLLLPGLLLGVGLWRWRRRSQRR